MFIKYMYNVFLKYVSQNHKESTVYSNVCLFQNYFPIRNNQKQINLKNSRFTCFKIYQLKMQFPSCPEPL